MYGIFAYINDANKAMGQVCCVRVLCTCVVFDSHDACMTMHVNACVCCVNQVRDLLFLFLSEEDPNTLPLVPVAARVVLGVQVRGGASKTYAPFPLGTKVRKTFDDGEHVGTITEHRGTLDDGNPEHYHVVYSDGDQEDMDAKECVGLTHRHNDAMMRTHQHISVCGILAHVFSSAAPTPKETVFTRAEKYFGSDGPNVGHPFAGR